jgi:hypothetical protein
MLQPRWFSALWKLLFDFVGFGLIGAPIVLEHDEYTNCGVLQERLSYQAYAFRLANRVGPPGAGRGGGGGGGLR